MLQFSQQQLPGGFRKMSILCRSKIRSGGTGPEFSLTRKHPEICQRSSRSHLLVVTCVNKPLGVSIHLWKCHTAQHPPQHSKGAFYEEENITSDLWIQLKWPPKPPGGHARRTCKPQRELVNNQMLVC